MSQTLRQIRRHDSTSDVSAEIFDLGFPELLEAQRAEVARALPKHIPVERILRVALTAFRKTPALGKCQPISVLAAVLQASQLGLEINQNGEAFLVPFHDECQLIPGYKGLMKLVRNSGFVKDIYAHESRVNDHFDFSLGLNRFLDHKPLAGEGGFPASDQDRGHVVGFYACALFADGTGTFDLKNIRQINEIRDASLGYQSAKRKQKPHPWDINPVPMGKKTVIRSLCNGSLPMSAELQMALALDSAADRGFKQGIKLHQAADGIYEPPPYDAQPDDEGNIASKGEASPTWRNAPRPEPRPEQAPRQPQKSQDARTSEPQSAPAHQPQPQQRQTPPLRPVPKSEAPQKPQSAPRQQGKPVEQQAPTSMVEQTIAKLKACSYVRSLDELMIQAEAEFSGADLEHVNQVYRARLDVLSPPTADLFGRP